MHLRTMSDLLHNVIESLNPSGDGFIVKVQTHIWRLHCNSQYRTCCHPLLSRNCNPIFIRIYLCSALYLFSRFLLDWLYPISDPSSHLYLHQLAFPFPIHVISLDLRFGFGSSVSFIPGLPSRLRTTRALKYPGRAGSSL